MYGITVFGGLDHGLQGMAGTGCSDPGSDGLRDHMYSHMHDLQA